MAEEKERSLVEVKTLILATGGEIESLTDQLAEEVAVFDEACAHRIRSLGSELADGIRRTAHDIVPRREN